MRQRGINHAPYILNQINLREEGREKFYLIKYLNHLKHPSLVLSMKKRYIIRSALPPINTFADIFLRRGGKLWNQPLHQVMTFNVESQLRNAAIPEILAVLFHRDFISQEVKYHNSVLLSI